MLLRRSPHGHVFAVCPSPSLTTATCAGADPNKTARRAASAGCDRVLAGYVPGRGAEGAAYVQAERRGHVHVPARARDPERVRADVVMPVCAEVTYVKVGALRDPVSSLSCVHCALGQPGWRPKSEQWNEWRNRPLLIENKIHILLCLLGLKVMGSLKTRDRALPLQTCTLGYPGMSVHSAYKVVYRFYLKKIHQVLVEQEEK